MFAPKQIWLAILVFTLVLDTLLLISASSVGTVADVVSSANRQVQAFLELAGPYKVMEAYQAAYQEVEDKCWEREVDGHYLDSGCDKEKPTAAELKFLTSYCKQKNLCQLYNQPDVGSWIFQVVPKSVENIFGKGYLFAAVFLLGFLIAWRTSSEESWIFKSIYCFIVGPALGAAPIILLDWTLYGISVVFGLVLGFVIWANAAVAATVAILTAINSIYEEASKLPKDVGNIRATIHGADAERQ